MDYDKLIEALRNNKRQDNCHDCALGYYAFEAATAIETLRADLARVTAERDAAIEDCSGYCASCRFEKDCAKHDMNDADPMRWYYGDCEDWEWRGIKKED